MYIALLGRQPEISLAELQCVFPLKNVSRISNTFAQVETDGLTVKALGGTQKTGTIIIDEPFQGWHSASQKLVRHYHKKWLNFEGKITLGLSVYDIDVSPREVQKTGIILKQKLKKNNVSLRLVPNQDAALSTATSHHNKLGLSNNKVELLIIRTKTNRFIVAESTGSQNITAYAKRDQQRPKRDAFVGMLPPKLAQIMINLAGAQPGSRILDPFCGTGVVLQEAALMGHDVYGTDLSEKMVDYSSVNLKWLQETHRVEFNYTVSMGDAIEANWRAPIGAVVSEAYLGQPFSAPPSSEKLAQVRRNCNHIIGSFLKNIYKQIDQDTPLCLAVPAWLGTAGNFTHLPLTDSLEEYGYKSTRPGHQKLLYYREDQVVARELLMIKKVA